MYRMSEGAQIVHVFRMEALQVLHANSTCRVPLSSKGLRFSAADQNLGIFWSWIDENSSVWLSQIGSDGKFDQIWPSERFCEQERQLFSSIFYQKMTKFRPAAKNRIHLVLSGSLLPIVSLLVTGDSGSWGPASLENKPLTESIKTWVLWKSK